MVGVKYKFMARILIILLSCQFILMSCNTLEHATNIIALDGESNPVSTSGKRLKCLADSSLYTIQLTTIREELRAKIESKEIDTVVLYIHGGMIGLKEGWGIKRSERILDSIQSQSPSTYPLFINWDSGLLSCYKDHLFKVKQGHEIKLTEGIIGAPFVFTYDVVRSFVRLPRNALYQLSHDMRDYEAFSWRTRNAHRVKDSLISNPSLGFHVQYGDDTRGAGRKLFSKVVHGGLSPIRYPVGLTLMELFGVNSWSVMKRRTTTMFHPQQEFGSSYHPEKEIVITSNPQGAAIGVFKILQLVKEIDSAVVVNIIGHSMGAIVACEALQTIPELTIDNVVFMAAACSFEDVERAVLPAMQRNRKLKFYNLTLNPDAEAREITVGSLLEQIDNFYEPISNFKERTFGKYENEMCVVHVIPESLRNRVFLKSFAFAPNQPYMHDSFTKNKFNFWSSSFWE